MINATKGSDTMNPIYSLGFQPKGFHATSRRFFPTAVEAASAYLQLTGLDGSVSVYADELIGGAIMVFERADGAVISVGENINPLYPSDDGYDDAFPHLRASEGC